MILVLESAAVRGRSAQGKLSISLEPVHNNAFLIRHFVCAVALWRLAGVEAEGI